MNTKFYTDGNLISEKHKDHFFFILDYIINDKSGNFCFVQDIENSDYAIYPLDIIYASNKFGVKSIDSFLQKSKKANKRTWVVSFGDHGFSQFDKDYDVIHFRLGGFKSKFRTHTEIFPPFIRDPYKLNENLDFNNNGNLSLGFVGHANGSFYKYFKELLSYILPRAKFFFKKNHFDRQKFYPSSIKRFKYLKRIEKSSILETNYIFRNKYRAGIQNNTIKRKSSERDFFSNINDNIFTFCMRGGGNFSVRFYETLASGRIPLYLDTDCKLPLEDIICWDNHILSIKPNDDNVAIKRKIINFIAENDLDKVQKSNRELWENYLEKDAYIKTILKEFKTH